MKECRVIQGLPVLEQCEMAKLGPGRHLEETSEWNVRLAG